MSTTDLYADLIRRAEACERGYDSKSSATVASRCHGGAAAYRHAASAQTWADDDEGWVRSEDFLYASTWGDDVAPAARAVSEFWKAIEDEGVFETVFGDHVAVLATREGFVVAEYSHD